MPKRLDLYVHIPFCRRVCVFCPYVKQVYDRDLSLSYESALRAELQHYLDAWGNVPVSSVFFGGGTPSMAPRMVHSILKSLRGNLSPDTEIGVEIHPLDATPDLMHSLRDSGVTMVSLGVQTFDDRLLHVLDRGYDARRAREACTHVLSAGFATADIDLIFSIPGQSVQEAVADVATAFALGADQVSTYPLIHFSHTTLNSHLSRTKATLSSWKEERAMLKSIVRTARDAGYERSSIWSFNKPGVPRYTTVTRDSFIGIGAGASSRMGNCFWVNTFDVPEYIATRSGSLTPALATRLDEFDSIAYWLFWRCYDTVIDATRLRSLCGGHVPRRLRAGLALLRRAGLVRLTEHNDLRLTDRGAYLFHLVEKQYTHAYLERLWSACLKDPWPEPVTL